MRSEEVCRMRRRFGLGFLIVALVVLFFVVAAVGMRLPHVLYARSHVISHFNSCRTEYGGLYTGLWAENLQSTVDGGGESALAFLLNAVGFPATTAEIRRDSGSAGSLSLEQLESAARLRGFQTQLVGVQPGYFRENPVAAILQLTDGRIVVFVEDAGSQALLFDPEFGQVYLPWKDLLKLFSGKLLYLYLNQ